MSARRGAMRIAMSLGAVLVALGGAPPAEAAISAQTSIVTSAGAARIVVALTSPRRVATKARPRSLKLVAGKKTYRLTRSGAAVVSLGTWRSRAFTGAAGAAVRALATKQVTLRLGTARGTKTLRSTVAAPGTGTPGAGTPGTGTPGTGPLFPAPARDLTGNEAAQALVALLGNSTFTDCAAGWPNCAVEERYGHFADGTMYYCRLTNSSGSDIINQGHAFQIIGADFKTDGSWAVSLAIAAYAGQTTYYTWSVGATGVANGLYWGPGASPLNGDPATQAIGPLQWVRGARNCSY